MQISLVPQFCPYELHRSRVTWYCDDKDVSLTELCVIDSIKGKRQNLSPTQLTFSPCGYMFRIESMHHRALTR